MLRLRNKLSTFHGPINIYSDGDVSSHLIASAAAPDRWPERLSDKMMQEILYV